MSEIRTENLAGSALNFAAAQALGLEPTYLKHDHGQPTIYDGKGNRFNAINDWSQAGPLLEWNEITLHYDSEMEQWRATYWLTSRRLDMYGDSALTAILRVIVLAKLGETVSIPFQ